jgi:hypothetical protein
LVKINEDKLRKAFDKINQAKLRICSKVSKAQVTVPGYEEEFQLPFELMSNDWGKSGRIIINIAPAKWRSKLDKKKASLEIPGLKPTDSIFALNSVSGAKAIFSFSEEGEVIKNALRKGMANESISIRFHETIPNFGEEHPIVITQQGNLTKL